MAVSGKKIAQRSLAGETKAEPSAAKDDPGEDLLYRQRDDDAGAVFKAGFDADVAAMRFNDATDDGQAESGAFGFGCA